MPSDDDGFVQDASQSADRHYSVDKFYTASSDVKGRSTWIPKTRVPPSVKGQWEALVASKQYSELRTVADVHRNILVHGTHLLADESRLSDLQPTVWPLRMWAEGEHLMEVIRAKTRMVDEIADARMLAKTAIDIQAYEAYARQCIERCGDPEIADQIRRMTGL